MGVLKTGSNTAGTALRMIFGVPVEPLLQMPCRCGRDDVGQVRDLTAIGGVDPRQVFRAEVDPRIDHLAEPVQLPVRHVPSHRNRYGAELPAGEGRDRELRRVPQSQPHPVAMADAAFGQRCRELQGPPVQPAVAHRLLGAVDTDMAVADVVRPLCGELGETLILAHDGILHGHVRLSPKATGIAVAPRS